MKLKIFLFLLFFLGVVNAAYSCSCLRESHKKEFRKASVVFVGRVVSISNDETYKPPEIGSNVSPRLRELIKENKRIEVKFEVLERFKGRKATELILYDYIGGTTEICGGISMGISETYLIYGYKDEGKIYVGGICSRTENFDETSENYRDLRKWKR